MNQPASLRSASLVSTLVLAIAIGAAGFAVGFVLTLVTLRTLVLTGIPVAERPGLLIVISVLMLQGVGFGSVALGYLSYRGDGFAMLDVSVPGIRDVLWFVGGLIALFVLLIALNLAMLGLGLETAQHQLVDIGLENPEILLLLVPLSILLVGPGEELLFRGIIQRLLRGGFGTLGGVVLTSLLFSFAHITALSGDGLLPTLIVYFGLSLLLGSVYEWSGNLVVPALIHGSFNAIQFLLLYLVATTDMAGSLELLGRFDLLLLPGL